MSAKRDTVRFSEKYGHVRSLRGAVREGPPVSESVVRCVWYDQLFDDEGLCTDDKSRIKVMWPGWWNRGEGPDFKGAQIEFDGDLVVGDVEIHLTHADWKAHGHYTDPRYDDVCLVVVLRSDPPAAPPLTSQGRRIPILLLPRFLEDDIREIADGLLLEEYPYHCPTAAGQCATVAQSAGIEHVLGLLTLAGEWRMLNRARALRERMERAGKDQAVYEAFLAACGFSHFKFDFCTIARQLPYERVRQLALQDPLLLEAAFLQIADLLPAELPPDSGPVLHFTRLRKLRRTKLAGLKSLPLEWRKVGVRPTNYPERRLAGAARFLSRTASEGLVNTLEGIWREDLTPLRRRRFIEGLFPKAMGFWANHCTWTGKKMKRPCAPLGPGRVRSIIGNVFVPAALALARQQRDRLTEERILEFFSALPKEPDNQIIRTMAPRLLGPERRPRLGFRMQQGLLQLYQDWCETNPSCSNCTVLRYLLSARPTTG